MKSAPKMRPIGNLTCVHPQRERERERRRRRGREGGMEGGKKFVAHLAWSCVYFNFRPCLTPRYVTRHHSQGQVACRLVFDFRSVIFLKRLLQLKNNIKTTSKRQANRRKHAMSSYYFYSYSGPDVILEGKRKLTCSNLLSFVCSSLFTSCVF